MAGIKQPLQDILNRLATLDVTNGDGNNVKLYARVWNNQVVRTREGELYDYPKPAAFVEFITPIGYEQLGGGFTTADIGINVHLVHEFYNQDGTFEQDLKIYDLRDKIVALLAQFKPTGCGEITFVTETPDYDHDNLNHYIVGFAVNFIDSKASPYDPARGNYIDKAAPTDLELNVTTDDQPKFNPIYQPFRIKQ